MNHTPIGFDLFWYACAEQERPPDGWVLWHYVRDGAPCRPCQIKAAALQRLYPGDRDVAWLVDAVGGEDRPGAFAGRTLGTVTADGR